jgi:hypothetical protein
VNCLSWTCISIDEAHIHMSEGLFGMTLHIPVCKEQWRIMACTGSEMSFITNALLMWAGRTCCGNYHFKLTLNSF